MVGERLAYGQRRVGKGLAKGWQRVGGGSANSPAPSNFSDLGIVQKVFYPRGVPRIFDANLTHF